jgi:hypothetical protein
VSGGGELKIIAAIINAPAIERILTHLGLCARAPPRSPAQAPPCFTRPDFSSTHPVRAHRRPKPRCQLCLGFATLRLLSWTEKGV